MNQGVCEQCCVSGKVDNSVGPGGHGQGLNRCLHAEEVAMGKFLNLSVQ